MGNLKTFGIMTLALVGAERSYAREGAMSNFSPSIFNSKMGEFKPKMKIYNGPNGAIVACGENFNDDDNYDTRLYLQDNCFYSPDGKTYYQMAGGPSSGSMTSEGDRLIGDFDSDFPDIGVYSKLMIDVLTLDCFGQKKIVFKRAPKQKIRADAHFEQLPNPDKVEYLLKDGSQYLVVTSPTYTSEYNFKMYAGKAGKWSPIKVNWADRYRDGGTTIVETEKGRLFMPHDASDGRPQIPKWRGHSVTKLESTPKLIDSLGLKQIMKPGGTKHTPCDGIKPKKGFAYSQADHDRDWAETSINYEAPADERPHGGSERAE